jgi:hypothetical protein
MIKMPSKMGKKVVGLIMRVPKVLYPEIFSPNKKKIQCWGSGSGTFWADLMKNSTLIRYLTYVKVVEFVVHNK